MEEKKKNKEIITVGLVLLLVVMIVGVSYAAFTFSKTGVTENAITTSAVTMIYTEGDNQISINNAVPITEEVGKTLSDENYVFDFTINIKTGPKMPISYEVTAVKDSSSTMGNEDVRLYLQKSLDGTNYNDEVLEPSPYTPLDVDDEFGAKAGEMVMDVGSISEKVTYYYRLRMWVDSSYELSSESKSFTVRVNVYGKEGDIEEPEPPKEVCRRATILHTEECGENQICADVGYTTTGSKGTSIITYGNLGTKGILTSGDAFDCDVNGDGIYDSETERFYYVTDLEESHDTAVMIHSKNFRGTEFVVIPWNLTYKNTDGPSNFMYQSELLGYSKKWTNIKLKNKDRVIKDENGVIINNQFTYDSPVRLLTHQEIEHCNIQEGDPTTWFNHSSCTFLFENTIFAVNSSGYWLETIKSNSDAEVWHLGMYYESDKALFAFKSIKNGLCDFRPVIEIPKSNINY